MNLIDAIKSIPKQQVIEVELTVEVMLERLSKYGPVTLMRMDRGGWWAYLRVNQDPAQLEIRGDSGMQSARVATLDLYRKAAFVLRFVP